MKGSHWPVQASLRLSKTQEKQLALQGRENAAALALQQGRCAGIVRALQVTQRCMVAVSMRYSKSSQTWPCLEICMSLQLNSMLDTCLKNIILVVLRCALMQYSCALNTMYDTDT